MDDFEKHYAELFDYVYRYVRIRVSDTQVTEDLVSKIFLDAYQNRSKYQEDKGSWRQWVTGIAKHCLLNHWRSHKVLVALEEIDLDHFNLQQFNEQSDRASQEIEFQRIMEAVPQNVKNLLIWRYVDDLTYEDIAQILDKKPAAVRKLFSRLIQQLKAKFNSDFEL